MGSSSTFLPVACSKVSVTGILRGQSQCGAIDENKLIATVGGFGGGGVEQIERQQRAHRK